jgi:hypothetical protein
MPHTQVISILSDELESRVGEFLGGLQLDQREDDAGGGSKGWIAGTVTLELIGELSYN